MVDIIQKTKKIENESTCGFKVVWIRLVTKSSAGQHVGRDRTETLWWVKRQ